ncbi:MAG TPA: DNA-processing protein DprA, partial [Vicinamibacterales bacterium]|nr:DNA-processing protein DprA [Vicinamibacterales bacterium]
MTDREAVALALFGYRRRRILAAVTRTLLGRPLPDVDTIPDPEPGESVVTWLCRCAARPDPAAETRTLLATADQLIVAAAQRGQRAVGLAAPAYPAPLRQIPDPPPVLWVRGDPAALSAPRMVAVVGARAATRGGLAVAADLAKGLAAVGVTVVSGL